MGINVYEIVTDRILKLLADGTVPWRKTWHSDGTSSMPRNLVSGKAYRGANIFMLLCAGYSSPYWLTFKQAKELGGSVKKGEKATPVIFWKFLDAKNAEKGDDNGDAPKGKKIPLLRYYNVFNVEQCEGLKHRRLEAATPLPEFSPIDEAEKLLKKSEVQPKLSHGGDAAYYSPELDAIRMPIPESFVSREAYYATLFHETTHATGHKDRLDRFERTGQPARFGSDNYGREELIAEMGAAFLCTVTGIENVTIANSASYIKHWMGAIKADQKAVVVAAAQAQKAVDLILGTKFEEKEEE